MLIYWEMGDFSTLFCSGISYSIYLTVLITSEGELLSLLYRVRQISHLYQKGRLRTISLQVKPLCMEVNSVEHLLIILLYNFILAEDIVHFIVLILRDSTRHLNIRRDFALLSKLRFHYILSPASNNFYFIIFRKWIVPEIENFLFSPKYDNEVVQLVLIITTAQLLKPL